MTPGRPRSAPFGMTGPHEVLVSRAGGDERNAAILFLHIARLARLLEIGAGARRDDACGLQCFLVGQKPLGAEVEAVVVSRRHDVEAGPLQVLGNLGIRHHEAADALTARRPFELIVIGKIHLEVAVRDIGILQQFADFEKVGFVVHGERTVQHAFARQRHFPIARCRHKSSLAQRVARYCAPQCLAAFA